MRYVLVVGNNPTVQRMFRERGWGILGESAPSPDLVCFTGGADIDPGHYGESRLTRTTPDPRRDAQEILVFEKFREVPKIGICRGGQLLNVLSGGALWQHVNNHASDHNIVDLLFTKNKLYVTSTHHQMMIPSPEGFVLAVAEKIATQYDSAKKRDKPKYDTEVVWYPKTKSMCFQPHPEYSRANKVGGNACQDYFFDLIHWAWNM